MLTLVDVTSFHPLVASYPVNYVASSLPFNLSGRCLFTWFCSSEKNTGGGGGGGENQI